MSGNALWHFFFRLTLNLVTEITPYWSIWYQTASNALCHFIDWVGYALNYIPMLCICNILLIILIPYCRGSSTLATFVAVYALFGPTFPGVYDKERSVYMLFYPVYLMNASLYFSHVYCMVGFVWCLYLTGAVFCFSNSSSVCRLLPG